MEPYKGIAYTLLHLKLKVNPYKSIAYMVLNFTWTLRLLLSYTVNITTIYL